MAPAFRADQVGSFLRPPELKEAHTAHVQGRLPVEELRELEDRCIIDVLKLQQEVGIDVYSDGEFRRAGWASDFSEAVDGYVEGRPAVTVFNTERGNNPAMPSPAARRGVIGEKLRPRVRLTAHEAGFMAKHAPGPFKMTMPAPSYVLSRGYHPEITNRVYGSRKEAIRAVAEIIRAEISALVEEGVPYIQLDNPHYPDYLMDDRNAEWRSVGIDPDQAMLEDIEADNYALSAVPRDRAVAAMHLCRGNGGRGQDQPAGWHSVGSYEAIAERVFGSLDVDRFLLEYDSERAGGFEPLRFVPKGRVVVLGLVTTKSGELESEELLLRRIDEASRHIPMESLALSPQCGFASTLAGNPLSIDEERRKLELVVDTARKAWG